MHTEQLTKVLSTAHTTLKQRGLSVGTYARKANDVPVGLHSRDVFELDLAASLWLASEVLQPDSHESLFRLSWETIRNHCGWSERGDKRQDKHFCLWLDKHNLEWHLAMLAEVLTTKPKAFIFESEDESAVETPATRPLANARNHRKVLLDNMAQYE